MVKDAENAQFEPIIEKLRALIEIIENDEGSIEESLKAYEEGVELVRQAQKYLADAEQRVNVLSTAMTGGDTESTE